MIASQDSTVDVVYTYAGFMGQFGERLYDDIGPLAGDTSAWLPSTLGIMSPAGVLRALPVHSETEIFIYNKEHFEAAGADPDNIPQTWDELYALAPKLTSGQPLPVRGALDRPDRPQVDPLLARLLQLVPGREVRLGRQHPGPVQQRRRASRHGEAIERGFKARFFDPVGVSLANDYESGLVFNAGQLRRHRSTTRSCGARPSAATSRTSRRRSAPTSSARASCPASSAGTHGGSNGFEGFGVNKFSKQKEAAVSFIKEVAGFDVQKAMNMTKILPSSRIDVLNDPEVVATYALAPTLVEQGKYNAYFVNTPYVVQPVFADATTKLWRGEYTAEQAHEAAVKGVEDLIIEYLTT